MAWVLSCLILSASFQSGQINNEVEVSQQSPLAQFNYAGKSYSLRFTGTKLENSDDQGDGPEATVELTLGSQVDYATPVKVSYTDPTSSNDINAIAPHISWLFEDDDCSIIQNIYNSSFFAPAEGQSV